MAVLGLKKRFMRGRSVRRRLDILLVERGLAESPERAKRLIMAGDVLVEGRPITKPGTRVADSAEIDLRGTLPYVSRGGLKLAAALREFHPEVEGKVALDVGASTGGFTDCLLQAGAAKVYAVDVGYGQLAWRLRRDPRVVVMERTNIRYLERLPEPADLAVIDVSFISLALVFPVVARLLRAGGEVVALIKPQFEAGREQVGRGGVVRDERVHRAVLEKVLISAERCGFKVLGLMPSPLKGPAGNVEFLAYLGLDQGKEGVNVREAVERCLLLAHSGQRSFADKQRR